MAIEYRDGILFTTTTTTTGTGTLTQSAAVTGYAVPVAGDDGKTFTIRIYAVDANGLPTGDYETCESVYTHSGTTWSRGTLINSSTGSRITFAAGTKRVSIVQVARDVGSDSQIPWPEISITTGTTLTLGRRHVMSGVSADYTCPLPTAVGNKGAMIHVRMDTALTKLVTIDGNLSETINGSLTRVMHAGESATLISDGANWFKTGGLTIPLACTMALSVNSSNISNNTAAKINMDTILVNAAGMADSTSFRIGCKRTGMYTLTPATRWNSLSGTAVSLATYFLKNATGNELGLASYGGEAGSYPKIPGYAQESLVAGDYLELMASNFSGATQNAWGNGTYRGSTGGIEELPTW